MKKCCDETTIMAGWREISRQAQGTAGFDQLIDRSYRPGTENIEYKQHMKIVPDHHETDRATSF
jgi:hypothetical protein